jgi:hypothetical protein
MVEYVRVCDAAGTGYFYIPGTETCLKIGGWARFQITSNHDNGGLDWPNGNPSWGMTDWDGGKLFFASTGQFNISSWTDSEIGPITTYMEFETPGGGDVDLDVVKLSFAGLTMGYFGGFLDNGINGETDSNGLTNKFHSIQYAGTAGAISFGASIDAYGWSDGSGIVWGSYGGAKFGTTAQVGFTSGAIAATLTGFYDFNAEGGGIVGRVSADLGNGTLQARGTWSQDAGSCNGGIYVGSTDSPDDCGALHWVAEVSYAAKVSDKLTLTPGFSYRSWYDDGDGDPEDTMWKAGVTADYKIAANLAAKLSVQYYDFNDGNAGDPEDQNGWSNFLRFQASF